MPPPVDVTDDPAEFEEAIKAFRRRVPMPDWKWDALSEAEKEFAFKVSGVAQADLATQAWEAVDRAIKDGTTLDDFKKQVGPQLEAAWGRENSARLETIFRTNALGAYNAGRHEILSHPEVRKARPFVRFDGVDDDRQSEICAALDGTIRPADDSFWHTHTPPLHFNCRSILVPLSEEEAQDEGVDDEAPEVGADEGFGKPPTVGGDWEPDTGDYPGPIGAQLEKVLEVAPAPAPEPDYGPAFPRVEPEVAPSELPAVEPIEWKKPRPRDTAAVFIARNDAQLKSAADITQQLTGTGTGVSLHVAKPVLEGGAAGAYWNQTGKLELSQSYVAEPMRDAVLRGQVTTIAEENAFATVLHEQFHAASNPARFAFPRGRRQMEESTTELLAQHYKRGFIERMGLRNTVPAEEPMFLHSDHGPALQRSIAYGEFIQGFARLVSYVDGVTAESPAAFERHVAGRALQVKRARNVEGENARYGMFVRPVLVKHGVKPTSPHFAKVSEGLTRLFADFISAGTTPIAELDTAVKRIVGAADYK